MFRQLQVIVSLAICALSASAEDVKFLPPSSTTGVITQVYPDIVGKPSVQYYDTAKAAAGALLYVNAGNFNVYPPPGTPFTFIPAKSAYLNYTQSKDVVYGHVALASDHTLRLTVNSTSFTSSISKGFTPFLKRLYAVDDVAQTEQFWSLEISSGLLTFLGARFSTTSAKAAYGVLFPTSTPEPVRLASSKIATGSLYLQGLLIEPCGGDTPSLCTGPLS